MTSHLVFLFLTGTLIQGGYVSASIVPHWGHLHSPHIINGTEAIEGKIPYQARIIMNRQTTCGGSLISDRWVLTAAHCIDGYEFLEVGLGAHNLSKDEEPGRLWYLSREAIMHELYDRATLHFDMGLIKLPEQVPLGGRIQVIKMAPPSFKTKNFAGKTVRISGWGKMGDQQDSPYSSTLQQTDLVVITGLRCFSQFYRSYTANNICAMGPAGVGSCYGDSGGPLIIRDNNTDILLGPLSFVSKAACAGNPSAYGRVSNYRDWIELHTGIPQDY